MHVCVGGWEGGMGQPSAGVVGRNTYRVERHGLVVDRARNRPTSQMVGSVEGPVSSVARKLEGERGKRKCERRYTSTPRLFSLLLFPFPSSSSLSSLLSIWVRPVHSPACHMYVMPWRTWMYVVSCPVSYGLGAKSYQYILYWTSPMDASRVCDESVGS